MVKYLIVALYIASIVFANWAFSVLPMVELFGALIPMATFVVGFTFVARDFAQRAIGHSVLIPMAIAIAISFLLADPMVAIASAAAFGVSELVDYGVYTWNRSTLKNRIMLSSVVSTPIDSFVFLALLPFPGSLTAASWFALTVAKLIGAGAVWATLAIRDGQVSRDATQS